VPPTPLAAQEPKPQYSVEDLQRAFASPAGAKTCEEQGLTTAADGSCERIPENRRGFSLPSSRPQAAAPAARPRAAGGPAPSRPRASGGGGGAASSARASSRDLMITFTSGSNQLTTQAQANARIFAEALKAPGLTDARFAIDGHTDAAGGRDLNMRLSRERAQALVDYLAGLGVDPARFEVNGYGFDRPLGRNARSAQNRRVEARRLN
jgi:outer membrane protein OmpA-like peptidoglycan-associated protein